MRDEHGPIRLRLLGPLELVSDEARLGGRKQRLVLSVLALRAGEVVPTDTLVDVVWPDDRPEDPQRSLQVHVSKLRRVLDEAGMDASIRHRGGGYVLQVAPDDLDVRRFEGLVDDGLALAGTDPERAGAALRGALELWRGEPLAGLTTHPLLEAEARRLEDLRLRALEARIDAELAVGRHDGLSTELRSLTDRHPLRERLWGQLMTALYRSGSQAEALAAYDRARRILADELGADPGLPLQELHRRILAQDPSLGDGPSSSTAPAASGGSRSLAVLPFDVIGGTEEASYLGLGLHSDLLAELSRSPELTVISRTSVLRYRSGDERLPVIARDLGAGTVVEGTLQGVGTRIRLTVRMVDASEDAQRWTASYEREVTTQNLFAIQSELARDIAAALHAELATPGSTMRGGRPPTASLEAYRLAAEARQHFDRKTEQGMTRAVELYTEASRLDPDYAAAWVGLALALASLEAYGHGDRHELLPRAEKAVHRALALELDSAEARTALGILHTSHQDASAALREFERAIRARPSHADAHNWSSWVSLVAGRADGGRASADRAVELDPLSAESHAHQALALAATGSPDRGLAAARLAGRLSRYETATFYEGICLAELGDHDAARRVLEPLSVEVRGEPGVPWAGRGPDSILAVCLAAGGETDRARRILAGLDPQRSPFAAGVVHLALGEVDEAIVRFDGVARMTAWPCLALHHYHGELWSRLPGETRGRLLRTAWRSWGVAAPSVRQRGEVAGS